MGLGIGALVFFNFAASAFLFFATRYTSIDKLGAALGVGHCLCVREWLYGRAVVARYLFETIRTRLGVGGSVLVTSIVFALMHGGAMYLTPIALPFMVAHTLTLGLACGY